MYSKKSNSRIYQVVLVVIMLIFSFLTPNMIAQAATTFIVDSNLDTLDDNLGDGLCHTAGNVCTLRAAIGEANAQNNINNTITFSISGTITLGSMLSNDDSAGLTIDGTGQSVIISGNNLYRVFYISSGCPLTLNNLTIANGKTTIGFGGGIFNNGGDLTIKNSAILSNDAMGGGGIYHGAATLTIVNSTISYNTTNSVGGQGGGIRIGGGTADIINSTIYLNSAATPGNTGGGIYRSTGTVTLRNTIVANNTTGGNCLGTITNGGNNIDDGTTCGWGSASGSMSSTDPLLVTPYANNGGTTQNYALQALSPAINAGDNSVCAATPVSGVDQRGISRPQGAACDIGAYEFLIPVSTSLVNSVLPTSRTPVVGNMVTIFNTVVNSGVNTANGITLSMNPLPAGAFVYQQTNCATNAIIGSPNPSLDLVAGGVLCYVLSFTPSATFAATNVQIKAQAINAPSTNLLTGINTWLLRSTAVAGPDIIALTTTVDFHQVACSGADAFAVALSNVGTAATGDITAVANTGSATLPLSISISETNPGTGAIIGDNILQSVGAGANRTVAVFVTYNGCVSFDPAANRIFVEFRDASNNVIGSTSTAVSTNR